MFNQIIIVRFSPDCYRILDQLTGLYFDLTRELHSWGLCWVQRDQKGEFLLAVQSTGGMDYALRKLLESASSNLRKLRNK